MRVFTCFLLILALSGTIFGKPKEIIVLKSKEKLAWPSSNETLIVTENMRLYLPSTVKTAYTTPKTYKTPQFKKEVKSHYTVNFMIYGLLFGLFGLALAER